MWKSSSDSCAWRRNASCSDTAKCHAFETFGSRPLASHGKRSAAMILYNDISISFAYISNEHCMVFASQKGARLGATAPVEMLSFTRLVALWFTKKLKHVIIPRFKPSQWLFKLVGWIKPFIPRILKSFLVESHWNTKKNGTCLELAIFSRSYSGSVQWLRPIGAYCVRSHHGVDCFLCAWQFRT